MLVPPVAAIVSPRVNALVESVVFAQFQTCPVLLPFAMVFAAVAAVMPDSDVAVEEGVAQVVTPEPFVCKN